MSDIKKRKYDLIFSLILLAISFLIVPNVYAQNASLYLSPSSGSFLVGSTFTVSIFVNTEGNKVNTVFAELKFPPEILQITSPTAGSSFIAEWFTPPNYSNEKGIVSFKGGIPGGISTSGGLISSITFRTVSSGIAKVEFLKSSKVLLADGKGTNILNTLVNGEYHILVPPPEGPKVFSPTHPNPDVWYPDSSPTFSWEKGKNVTDFSWVFNQNPNGKPDGISEGNKTMVSFSNVQDGVWYFHIRQKKKGIWGKTTHIQLKIDTTPPDEFTPKVKTYNKLTGYRAIIYFKTTDNLSGVDHYEVSLVNLSTRKPSRSFFIEEISPYEVPIDKNGKYSVIIKAVDKAGNSREAEAKFRATAPLIIHIGAFSVPLWQILLFLIIGGVFIVIWLYRRKIKYSKA